MGVDLSTYRARIGCFRNPAFHPLCCWQSCLLVWMVISQLMLKLAGDVEENPGPKDKNASQFTVYARQLNNQVVALTLHPSDTLVHLREKVQCPPAKVKFYHCAKQLNERVPLQEQGIANDSNIELHVGLQGGAGNDYDGKEVERKLSENMEEWSENNVEMWLRNHVKLKEEYIQKIKDEQMNGHNVKNTFTLDFLQSSRIQIKSGPAMKVIGKRDALRTKAEHIEDDIENMTVEETCEFLKCIYLVKEEYVSKFREEEFDGWNLKHSLSKDYLDDVIKMKLGPMHCLLDKVKQLQQKDAIAQVATGSSDTVVRPKVTIASKPETSNLQPVAKPSVSSRTKEYQDMLQNCIHLKTKACIDDQALSSTEATLELIYSKWGTKRNQMDAHFCFLLLRKAKVDLDVKHMWKKIREQLPMWVSLLDPAKKAMYESVDGSGGTMMVKGTKDIAQLSQKAPKRLHIMSQPADEIQKYSKFVLLVDEVMLTQEKTRYHTYLAENSKTLVTFDFSKEHYWVASFDQDDLSVQFAFNNSDLGSESFQHLTMSAEGESDHEPEKSALVVPPQPMQCAPRPFRQYKQCSYHQGRVLADVETGVANLLHPAREFKFSRYKGEDLVDYFIEETLRFSCACLNMRTNGTIHFGIADNKSGDYRSGEVIGVSVTDEERANFEEKLTSNIDRCFRDKDQKDAAKTCISRPFFVRVSGIKECRYVIEVDVTPIARICESLAFKVSLPSKKKEMGLGLKLGYYERFGSSSCLVPHEDIANVSFFQRVKNAQSERKRKENESMAGAKLQSLSNLAERLKYLFCHGRPRQISSYYHILVANKPLVELIDKGHLGFITCIDWVAVFDFDPDSFETGLAKLYKERGMNELFSDEFSNCLSMNFEDFCLNINVRNRPLWISCNGRNRPGGEAKNEPLDVKKWREKRRKGVKDAISFLSREEFISDESKVVVTFLLFTDDYETIIDTCGYVVDEFKIDKLLYVAENDTILHGWNTELEKVFSKDEHTRRGIVGMPWNHINETIKQFVGAGDERESLLPTSTGTSVALKESDRKKWHSLDVLCLNQCENSEMIKNKDALERHRQEKEEEFWKGKKIDWWNFWLTENNTAATGQVLKRDDHEKLKGIVCRSLTGDMQDTCRAVGIVHLFHHPSAGGSTMASHILWDLRKDYRCAVVKSHELSETISPILDLYSYKEPDSKNRRPVLVLIDHDDVNVEQLCRFKEELQEAIVDKRFHADTSMPVCVLLHCMRSLSARALKQQNITTSVVLKQRLSQREINWCNQQLDKCLEYSPERDPRQFLSFKIMKENFNPNNIKTTVEELLCSTDLAESEKTVLKFVSLLNKFVKDSAIPVARCKILGTDIRKQQESAEREDLSPSAQLLLVEVVKEALIGPVVCYSTVHPLVADQILNHLCEKDKKTYGDVTLDFIKSDIFKTKHKYARGYIVEVTGEMLKKRQRKADNTKENFSPLILHICEEENGANKALEVMTTAYEELRDELLGQQVVRLLYIKAKDFKKARHYALECKRQNSCGNTLDTIGQVEKADLINRYQIYLEKQEDLSLTDATEAVKLAFQAIKCFREAQAQNFGFVGEVQVCFFLLKLLQCISLFKEEKGRKRLCNYLMGNKPPPSLEDWNEYRSGFKELDGRMSGALQHIAKRVETCYNHCALNAIQFLVANYRNYSAYFCMSPDDITDEGEKCESRRRQVEGLRGSNFFNIFEHVARKDVHTLGKIREILKANVDTPSHRTQLDIQNYIFVNLALAAIGQTFHEVPPPGDIQELFDLTERLVDMSDGTEAFPYFLLYMFMWPTEDKCVKYDHYKFISALKKLDKMEHTQRQQHKIQATGYPRRASALFFLGRGTGVKKFVHVGQLPPFRKHGRMIRAIQGDIRRDRFWNHPAIPKALRRLTGTQTGQIIHVGNGKEKIKVRPASAVPTKGGWLKQVNFYLGFSMAGPVAYDVQSMSDDEAYHSMSADWETGEFVDVLPDEQETQFDYNQYQVEMGKLQSTLKSIDDLKRERDSGRTLTKEQEDMVTSEGDKVKERDMLIQECRKHLECHTEEI